MEALARTALPKHLDQGRDDAPARRRLGDVEPRRVGGDDAVGDGLLEAETISYMNSKGRVTSSTERKYLYQKDGRTPGNWIRKVVTPENTIIARRITYFEEKPIQPADSIPGN